MKLFHLLGFTKELAFGCGWSASVTRLNLFLHVSGGSHFLNKEPAGIVCRTFEAISRGGILLELEMISFLPIIVAIEFAHLLRMFLCFYTHF